MLLRVPRILLSAVLCCGAMAPVAAQQRKNDPPAILSVIPEDCWGFVEIDNVRALDEKLAAFLEQLEVPPFALLDLLQTRLNLGPQITYDRGLAVVLMPCETFAELGTHSVLVFPCDSVESLLSEFVTEKLGADLWRSVLIWGPTYIAQRGRFAIFGSTEHATTTVLKSSKSIAARMTGSLLDEFERNDVNVWINARRLMAGAAMKHALDESDDALTDQRIFGTGTVLAMDPRTLGQIESALVGLQLNAARIKLSATILPVENSALSKLLAFGPPQNESLLAALPDQPFIAAAAGRVTPGQMQAKAAEFDKFFASSTIKSATEPEKLQQLRQTLGALIQGIQGGAWALSTQPESPQGLAAVIGVLEVEAAQRWIDGIRKAADLLGEGFFVNESANRYYHSVAYLPNADTITSVPIHHVVLDLIDQPGDAALKKVDYSLAFGPAKKIVQIAALDERRVAVCVGDHPRLMAALIASARGRAPGLDQSAGAAKVRQLLPRSHHMFMLFSPAELIRLGRTLARMQDKVEAFSYQTPKVSTPIGATVTGTGTGCRVDAVLPLDLAAGLKALFFESGHKPAKLEPPSAGN